MERVETPTGRKYDAWFIDGRQAGTLTRLHDRAQRAGLPAVDEPRVVLAAGWRLHPFHPRRAVTVPRLDPMGVEIGRLDDVGIGRDELEIRHRTLLKRRASQRSGSKS